MAGCARLGLEGDSESKKKAPTCGPQLEVREGRGNWAGSVGLAGRAEKKKREREKMSWTGLGKERSGRKSLFVIFQTNTPFE